MICCLKDGEIEVITIQDDPLNARPGIMGETELDPSTKLNTYKQHITESPTNLAIEDTQNSYIGIYHTFTAFDECINDF